MRPAVHCEAFTIPNFDLRIKYAGFRSLARVAAAQAQTGLTLE